MCMCRLVYAYFDWTLEIEICEQCSNKSDKFQILNKNQVEKKKGFMNESKQIACLLFLIRFMYEKQ